MRFLLSFVIAALPAPLFAFYTKPGACPPGQIEAPITSTPRPVTVTEDSGAPATACVPAASAPPSAYAPPAWPKAEPVDWPVESTIARPRDRSGSAAAERDQSTTAPELEAAVTRFQYDRNRNLTEQTDARGNTVEMQYDVMGRPVAMIQPGGLTTSRTYDENGNLLVLTDPKGQTVTNTYDEWNRLKTKVYTFAPGDPDRPWRWLSSIRYQYDANDNVTRVEQTIASGTDPPPSSPNQITTRTYDDFDRLLSETVTLPHGGTKTVSYTYYLNGNRKTLTDPDGVVTSYTYDGQNRLETVTTPEGVTTYTYWPDDLLKTVTYPSGVVSSYDYDLADRLTSLVSRQGATVVSSYAYTYDANGNRLSQTETNGGAPEVTTYTYDARDRLKTVTYTPDAAYAEGRIVTYEYDQVGNRTSEITTHPTTGAVLASKAGTFDAVNRLTLLADGLDSTADITFDYDRNGNQIAKTVAGASTAFRYDVRDRLVEVESPSQIAARFEYDADGRLSKKIGEDGVRQYVYDEDARFQELDHTGVAVARYSYGADRLISLVRADEGARFYHLDGLGSVTALTDPTGAVTSRLSLDAWGVFRNPDAPDGPFASKNRFAFTSYVFDRETELYFAKARFYDPTVGRFTSQDSFLGDIDRPPSLHRYFYGFANPLRYIDPTGHASEEEKYFETAMINVETGNTVALAKTEEVTVRPYRDSADELASAVNEHTGALSSDHRPSYEKAWNRNFLEELAFEVPMRALPTTQFEGLMEQNPTKIALGTGETALTAVLPPVVRTGVGRLIARYPRLSRPLFGSSKGPRGVPDGPATVVETPPAAAVEAAVASAPETGAALARYDPSFARSQMGIPGTAHTIRTSNMTATEAAAAQEYASRVNAFIDQSGSPLVRTPTKGTLRRAASAEARRERLRAERAGTPYQGRAGHVPDTTWTGQAKPPAGWLDMPGFSNDAIGGFAGSARPGVVINYFKVE